MHLKREHSSISEYNAAFCDLQSNNPDLTQLHLQWCDLHGAVCLDLLDAIATKNTHLLQLKIGNLSLKIARESEVVESIVKILRENSTLQELDLDHNHLGSAACIQIFGALGENTSLIKLHMGGNDVCPVGAEALTDALRRNVCLQELYFGYEGCGDAISSAVAQSLFDNNDKNGGSSNGTLRVLSMVRCRISKRGGFALGEALKHNTSLEHLCLDYNPLGDEGCRGIVEGLMFNASLNALFMSCCSIGSEGAMKIANLLLHQEQKLQQQQQCQDEEHETKSGLKTLSIFDNNIRFSGAISIFEALSKNSILETLDIKLHTFLDNESGWNAMERALAKNYKISSLGHGTRYSSESCGQKTKIMNSLRLNTTKPLQAQVVKGGSFPTKKLSWLDHSAPPACHVEAIAKVVSYASLSGLYSFVRERPTFFGAP